MLLLYACRRCNLYTLSNLGNTETNRFSPRITDTVVSFSAPIESLKCWKTVIFDFLGAHDSTLDLNNSRTIADVRHSADLNFFNERTFCIFLFV